MSLARGCVSREALAHAALAIGIAACAGPEPRAADAPRLELQWTGADTGRITSPATAEWCGVLRVLQIDAVRGDTGIAIALYPRDSIRPTDPAVTSILRMTFAFVALSMSFVVST